MMPDDIGTQIIFETKREGKPTKSYIFDLDEVVTALLRELVGDGV